MTDTYHKYLYVGPSMNPTMKHLDVMVVIPYKERKIKCGDVIVFSHPESGKNIVHRVVSIDSKGIRTRGDNSNEADSWLLDPEEVHGYVAYVQRRNRQKRISGSLAGHLFAATASITQIINYYLSTLFSPIYQWFARKGIFKRWLPAIVRIRVISFNRPEGKESQLLIGRHLIGRCPPGKNKWHIKRPFRLFLDEKFLADF